MITLEFNQYWPSWLLFTDRLKARTVRLRPSTTRGVLVRASHEAHMGRAFPHFPTPVRWARDVVDSTAYPSEMEKSVEQGNDGVRVGLGNKHVKTRDLPRFRALLWR